MREILGYQDVVSAFLARVPEPGKVCIPDRVTASHYALQVRDQLTGQWSTVAEYVRRWEKGNPISQEYLQVYDPQFGRASRIRAMLMASLRPTVKEE